jgi:hypothetical protein
MHRAPGRGKWLRVLGIAYRFIVDLEAPTTLMQY